MRAVFSSLMTVWMAILTMTGWCCHSPFCAHLHRSSGPAARAGECCNDCCCPTGQSGNSTRPCRCCTGCQRVCTYLPPQKVQLDGLDVTSTSDFAAVLSSQADAELPCASRWVRARDPARCQSSLRLHLRHQILLI